MKQLFRSHGILIVFTFMTLVAVTAIASSVYLYTKYQSTTALLKKNTGGSEEEIRSLVSHIGSFMELPGDEAPTLATVTDTSKLPSIPFFARARTGDKVLIYQKAAKAILYRPSSKMIIDTSVFTSQGSAIATESAKKSPDTIELRNGTTVTGLTAVIEKKLSQVAPEFKINTKSPAKRKDYTDSIVIAKDPQHEQTAIQLAKLLDFAVGPLPAKEASFSSDILIIAGSDSKNMDN